MRQFRDWFSRFRKSISDYDYYTDFGKVYEQVDRVRVELHLLKA